MEMPLASAAKRGWTFIFVPMMLAFPLAHPSVSIYCRMRGPITEADPASDNPNPSRIVFFPSATTFSGMSSYFAFTINSETYLVRPGSSEILQRDSRKRLIVRYAPPIQRARAMSCRNHVGSLETTSAQFCRARSRLPGAPIIARQGILIVICLPRNPRQREIDIPPMAAENAPQFSQNCGFPLSSGGQRDPENVFARSLGCRSLCGPCRPRSSTIRREDRLRRADRGPNCGRGCRPSSRDHCGRSRIDEKENDYGLR